MADNTVTLVVNGEVSLETFSRAVADFNELVQALTEEAGGSLDWLIQDLQISSAVVASKGEGAAKQIEDVVLAYEDVATSLEKDAEIKHIPRVRQAALRLVDLPDHRIPSLLMQTAKRDAIVPTRLALAPKAVPAGTPRPVLVKKTDKIPAIASAYGALEGRIQTLTSRGSLRFTLYDLLYDKAVSCYVTDQSREMLRDIWGKLCIVEGLIARDPENGRPLSVRDIRGITPIIEGGPLEYQEARGVVRGSDLTPEEVIRRMRDAQ